MTKSEKLIESWKNRKDYLGESKNTSIYNTHRSICYTIKGKTIGYPENWQLFNDFKNNVPEGFKEGFILVRKNKKEPYSKENCFWTEKGTENVHKLSVITYNSETKTLLEWAKQYNLNYNGLRQRYFKGKNYTSEEILFGKIKNFKKGVTDINLLASIQAKRNKISKMLSAYKNKDNKKQRNFNLTREFMEKIINSYCIYCGDVENVGCDRLDNNKGHTVDNVVPACYQCNSTRNNFYSFEEMLEIGKTIKQIKLNRNAKNK